MTGLHPHRAEGRSRALRRLLIGSVATLVAATVAGCDASPISTAASTSPPVPSTGGTDSVAPAPIVLSWSYDADAVPPPTPGGALNHLVVARWDEDGRMLLTTWGSSSCPELPVELTVASPAEVVVEVRAWSGTTATPMTCTADFSPTVSVLELPADLDRTASIMVRVGDRTAELLPLRNAVVQTWRPEDVLGPPAAWQTGGAAPEEVSSVAWDDQGRILLITWGSGSCPDVVSTVDLESETEIVLGITNRAEQPFPSTAGMQPDQVGYECSSDMSPLISRFDPPPGLDTTRTVTVRLDNGLALELTPRP